jgi:hypothetical protein
MWRRTRARKGAERLEAASPNSFTNFVRIVRDPNPCAVGALVFPQIPDTFLCRLNLTSSEL